MEAEQHLVNGALMKKYVGSEVRLWIEVSGTSSGGRQVNWMNFGFLRYYKIS